MKRKVQFILSGVLFLFFITSTIGYAQKNAEKEFPFTIENIINNYNDIISQLELPFLLDRDQLTRGKTKHLDSYSILITDNIGLLFHANKGKLTPYSIKAIGVDDGDENTQALIALNCMALMAAVTPSWTGEERGNIAKRLGITSGFPKGNKRRQADYKGLHFIFGNTPHGLVLSIEPR